jgi:heme A synthase
VLKPIQARRKHIAKGIRAKLEGHEPIERDIRALQRLTVILWVVSIAFTLLAVIIFDAFIGLEMVVLSSNNIIGLYFYVALAVFIVLFFAGQWALFKLTSKPSAIATSQLVN